MMEQEQDKQAVVEGQTDAQATPAAEGTDAQGKGDDLDNILAEFNEATKEPQAAPQSTPEQSAADDPTLKRLEQVERSLAEREFKSDMATVIEKVRGDLDDVPDKWVRGWINTEAEDNPALQDAWNNRHRDPTKFSRVVKELGKQFSKEVSNLTSIDKQATEDREAVTQAVRGSSSKAPEGGDAPDLGSLNDAEARAAHEKAGLTPQF